MSKIYYKNRENLKNYFISEDWYKNRKPGVSAMIRCYNEERWIGPCLESILPFFDEIVITLTCTDRTKEIIDSFNSKKIKVYDYPFYLGEVNGKSYPDSVHDRAYYSNWSLSKTTHQIVAKWDADMIMLPTLNRYRKLIESKNVVRLTGYNVVKLLPTTLSKKEPYEHTEPRFFRIHKNLYFLQASVNEQKGKWFHYTDVPLAKLEVTTFDRAGLPKIFTHRFKEWLDIPFSFHCKKIFDILTKKDVTISEPTFIHTKYTKTNIQDFWYPPDADKFKEPGEVLYLNLPDYFFKKPEDYL